MAGGKGVKVIGGLIDAADADASDGSATVPVSLPYSAVELAQSGLAVPSLDAAAV